MLTSTDLERQTLRLYGELLARADRLGGRFVFCCGVGVTASGLPAAVSIAGGVSLLVDPDAGTVKSVFRRGGVDFVVNTLDEALRVLKNELRKHTPLSVALVAQPQPVLDEMAARGVLPDLEVLLGTSVCALPAALQSLGMVSLRLAVSGLVEPSPHAAQWLAERGWSEHRLPVANPAELRALDVRLMQHLVTAENQRLQWLRRIPHYQRPGPGRLCWLTPEEAAELNAPTGQLVN